jgi:isoleucyl-tRNA synthetase
MKVFASKISSLNFNAIKELMSEEKIEIEVDNEVEIFTTDEIDILQEGKQNSNTISNRKISIDLDCTLTPELKRAGYAREFVNRIQRLRKDRDFEVSDRIALTYKAEEVLSAAIEEHLNYIMNETLSKSVKFEKNLNGVVTEIDDLALEFDIKQLKKL